MTIYLDCYTTAQDLLRAVSSDLSSSDYNYMWTELEQYDLSKDELAEELIVRYGLDIEPEYP